jgi:hypothetical protein
MARIVFTANSQRHIACPAAKAAGRTVREGKEPAGAAMCSTTRRRCASTCHLRRWADHP